MEDNCYTTETLYFDKGLFDSFIDITFVITMANSPRNKKIIKEIKRVKPTKTVIIVYNSGFKNCEKSICNKKINKARIDLVHTNMYIFNQSSQYNNILILEDDTEFSDEIFNPKHINNIKNFIENNNFNTYSLGSVKLISGFGTHNRIFSKLGAHAMIYSKKFNEQFNQQFNKPFNKCKILDMDYLTNIPYNLNGWGYYKTLAGQVWEETENSKSWLFGASIIQPLLYYFTKDNCIQGIENMNLIIKILWLLILLILLWVIYYIHKTFRKGLITKILDYLQKQVLQ